MSWSRSCLLVVMLFAMLWQASPLALAGSALAAPNAMKHTLLHWQDTEHHHHHDGSYHVDDSRESAKHMLVDHLGASPMLEASGPQGFPPLDDGSLFCLDESFVPLLSPDGMFRPPRHHS